MLNSAGDKPEMLYPEAERELKELGFSSTVEYVAGLDLSNFVTSS